jgi:cell division protein FtsB
MKTSLETNFIIFYLKVIMSFHFKKKKKDEKAISRLIFLLLLRQSHFIVLKNKAEKVISLC